MKLLHIQYDINPESLLSSRTYPSYGFNRCIYCHKDVENCYYEFNEEFYQPYRCNCEHAKKEIEAKEELLKLILNLENDVDIDKVNNNVKEYLKEKINMEYDELE